MNIAAVYLWKEWREQRVTLGLLALVLLACIAASAALLPRELVRDPLVLQWAISLCGIATVLSIGSDLLARERQQRAMPFLERVPRGLDFAFRGKLGFLTVAVLGAMVYGALIASCAAVARTGELPIGLFAEAPLWIPAVALGASLWIFALSGCVPTPALSLPATIFALSVLAWPALLATLGYSVLRPTWIEGLAFLTLCVVGAPVSAWASFVLGSRRGRSRRNAALIGLSVATPFFLPTWIWAGMRYATSARAPIEIVEGWVGADGRHAFLNLVWSSTPNDSAHESGASKPVDRSTAIVVDLEDGEWRRLGRLEIGGLVETTSARRLQSLIGPSACTQLELLEDDSSRPRPIVDMRTAFAVAGPDELPAPPGSPSSPSSIGPNCPIDSTRIPSPSDFGLTLTPPTYSMRCAGLGQSITFRDDGREREIFRDPARGLVVDRERLMPQHSQGYSSDVRIRPGRWLARTGRTWSLIDPVSCIAEPAPCIALDEQVGPSVDDGRVVIVSHGSVFLLDPDSGRREEIRIDSRQPRRIQFLSWGSGSWRPPVHADVPMVVAFSASAGRGVGWLRGVAQLDVRARTLRLSSSKSPASIQLLATDAAHAIAIENATEIVRHDLEHDRRDVLFSVRGLR